MNDVTQPERRAFIKKVGLVGAGVVAGSVATGLYTNQDDNANQNADSSSSDASPNQITDSNSEKNNTPNHVIPFEGKHQAGILTPAQADAYFIVLDLHTDDVKKVKDMFKMWTNYSRKLTMGENIKPYSKNIYVPPTDTGEADSLNAHDLTLTFGVSPSFFSKLGIEHLRPAELKDLPHFPRDQLKEPYMGGDICIQACANDPQVAFHAVRNLIRSARSLVTMKWSQSGFNATDNQSQTPRNLFAFKDGTANEQGSKEDSLLWVENDSWLNNGSYLIVRRIKQFLETWDRTGAGEQNNTFGRDRSTGSAFGEKDEFDEIDINKKDENGEPILPEDSHVALAKKTEVKLLRRSFSYSSGIDVQGQFDAGLLFISFQASPSQFITIQNSFGNMDKMNEYISHMGSGIFACFAGVENADDYLGRALFEQIG